MRATVAAAIAAHEESGGSRHDSSGRRGAWYLSEMGVKRVKDFDGQFKVALKNACAQVFHLVTVIERAESKDAMVEIVTLEATSLNDGDLEQMATELFDILAMTIQGITNFNGFEAWKRMVTRYAPTNPATALVAVV